MLCQRFSSFANYIPSLSTRLFHTKPTRSFLDLSLMLVTTPKFVRSEQEFFSKIRQAVEGGVTCVQLRDPENGPEFVYQTACRVKKMLDEKNVPLIINDRHLNVALAVRPDGIYLENRNSPSYVRHILGSTITIGVPVHTDEDLMKAEKDKDVDFLSVKVFASKQTNPEDTKIGGVTWLNQVSLISDKPRVAIGGINLENLKDICTLLRVNDKDGIAMVGDLWRAEDPSKLARQIRHIMHATHLKA